MSPRKIKNLQEGVTLGLLVLCLSSDFVTAGSLSSHILKEQTKYKTIDCLSCDSPKKCALRQNELQKCEEGSCMTIFNNKGLVEQRGCSSILEKSELTNYCAENTEKCITCDTIECDNKAQLNVTLTSKRSSADAGHQCYQCNGSDDCEEGGDIVECTDPKNGVLCYMKFSGDVDVTNMGCLSDFGTEAEIIELVKQKLLYVCEGGLCNGFENIPQPNECSSCSSSGNEGCALQPATIDATVNCNVAPYTHCYELVDNETNGITKRGCSSSLDGESLWECLNAKNGGTCRLCTGNGCNNQIIPADRLKCHRCDSTTSANCEDAPKSLGICPVYNKDESCISSYEAGVTRRGCSSDLKCDANSHACQICKGEGCNTINMKKRAEEIYGIFQDLPLNCNTCKGEECESDIKNPRKCEDDPLQDCLTIFDESGKVIRRGCELEVLKDHAAHCEAHPELCFNCKSNGCNTANDASNYQECLVCDAATNPDCLFHPEGVNSTRKCVQGCVSSLYPRKSNPQVYDFVRMCFEDIESDDRDDCKVANNCVKCIDKNKCNTDILPEEGRLTCLHCDGDDCDGPVSKTCTGFSSEDQCYIFFSDEHYSAIKMGCRSELLPGDVDEHIKQYFICDGDDCNSYANLPEAKSCFSCNSATDENCAVDPSKITSLARCQSYPFTECTSWINEFNHTVRGCHYDSPIDIFKKCSGGDPNTICKLCTESRCNGGIYPGRRQQCHRCNSNDDANCEASPTVMQACPLYHADDACVTKLIDGVTHRGCRSELTCEGANRKNCQVCEKSNCNIVNLKEQSIGEPGLFQGLPLNCYHCNGTQECAGSSTSVVKECEGNNFQTCTVAFASNGTVIGRGCSDLLDPICDKSRNKCYDCKSNECNTALKKADFIDCVYCDAREGDKCTFEVDTITRKRKCHKGCMTALYARTNESEPVYELIRTCLDDKESDDQVVCQAGNDPFCKACTSSACNVDSLGERKSCYHCSGENCQAPTASTCRAVMEHDQCFIEYDETGVPVQMGCKSDYDPQDIKTLLYNKRIWLCDEENCNDIENAPTAQRCIICNSRTDPNCAVAPKDAMIDTNCNKAPYTQCYMRILPGGHTDRGCASNLKGDEFIDCLLNANVTACMTCSGEKCNKEVFPADRRRCHRCNTQEDPLCESAPEASAVCPLYSKDEFCATKIESDHTYRGCSSEFQCDPTDPNFCRMCKGSDNCNTVDLIGFNVGYPGKWQGLPLNCYHCEGEECATGNGLLRKCVGDTLQTCASVFDNTGKVVQRSCSLDVHSENTTHAAHCIDHPELCKFCKSSGCNTAKSLNDYVDCIFCDGSEKAECVRNVAGVTRRRSCHKACMTGLYPRKDESNPAFELSRSCLDDLNLDEREACEKGDMKLCKSCNGSACNIADLPETLRLKCLVCNGNNCNNPKSEECLAYREHDQCFALFDTFNTNAVIRLGCSSDLDSTDLFDERRRLFQCDGDNCNHDANFPKPNGCVICDSINELFCATKPAETALAAGCDDMPWTNCYTQVDKNGITRRGCLSDASDELFDECVRDSTGNCVICNGNDCNKEIFPRDRRSCHRCDSSRDPTCENNPHNFTSICPIYNASDSCVTKVEGARTRRGCASDFTCDPNDQKTCHICDSDDCNSINLLGTYIGDPGKWQDLPLNCYHCEGEECANGNGLVGKCEHNNLQTCMTVFDKDGKVGKRGCSDSVKETHLEYCEENSENCFACKSNGCNTAKSLSDYQDCYFCDSNHGKGCSVNFDSSKGRIRRCQGGCIVALYPRSSVEDPAYELLRTCLDDVEEDDRVKCSNNEWEHCESCEGDRCNTMSVPAERHECFQCLDEDCEDFEAQACNAYHPNDQCYILYDEQNTISHMGCRSEYEMNVVTDLIKQKRLILCDGKNCNKPEIVKTMTCLACDSAEDPRCATNPNLVDNFIRCSSYPYTDCGTFVNEDGHTIRGCVANFSNEIFYGCITNSDGLCETCSSNNCNAIDIFPANRMRCHQCESTSNEKCTSMPDSNRVCPIYDSNDACISDLRSGITYRGCASSMKCYNENDKRSCRTCKTPGCNNVDLVKVGQDGEPGKWQEVPINCLVCTDEEDCKITARLGVCEGNPYQNCMTVFNKAGNVIERGCSDAVEVSNTEWCKSSPENCPHCNSNGCNIATSLDDFVECLACDTDIIGQCVSDVASVTKTRKCYKHCMTAMYPRENETNPAYNLARSCLDDLELDDRVACADGSKEYCKVCEGAKCNTIDIPEKRLSCNMCKGENCQLPEKGICPQYREGDQCYILFDEQRTISAMGCRSELSNADADFYYKQKRLYLCTDDNCNNVESLPAAQSCKICSSRTDVSCATNPSGLQTSTTCNLTPFTECYTLWRKDGSTERGCVSSLYDDDFLACLSDDSSFCQTCKGNECNKEVFPAERAVCHICDSSADPACESKPDNVSICTKYDPADTCVTTWRNGITQRGCSSSISCEGTNSRGCSKCTGEGCNTINLAKRQDDNFGKWQDLPLRCHVCTSDDCDDLTSTTVATCEDNNEQDCVVVFDKNGKVIARGCADKIEESHGEYCDKNEDHCINCKSNECNAAVSLDEFTECLYCDTHKNLSCLWQPLSNAHRTRQCRGGCMTALYPSDSSTEPTYDLIRTCLDDKDTNDQKTCSNGRDANCQACTDAGCNTVDLPKERLKCFYCVDGDCEEPASMKCPLYKQGDQCYIWFDSTNSVSEMGCLSSFRNQELESIIKTKRVFVCNDGDNCNSLDKLSSPQKCAVCDSNKDSKCAINAKSVSEFKECNMMPFTGCYSKLNMDGSTSRGCQTDLDETSFVDCVLGKDKLCEPCTGDGCNREIFPADRQQCHTCTSLDDPNCESFPTRVQPCPIVSNTESCKTALNGNETVRGCSSEILCDASDRFTCRSCFGTQCNAIDLRNLVDDGYHGAFQDLPLKCHECRGEHCLSSLGPVVACSTYDRQDCKTVFNVNGTVRRRGCSDNVDDYEDLYCRKNPELCFSCKSNECNIAWELNEYVDCAFCNSSRSLECVIEPETTMLPQRKCYKQCMVTMSKNGEVIRSCLDDKEVFNQVDCRTEGANRNECSSCGDENCNTFVFPHNRLKCHVCTSADCTNSTGQYCVKYDENDFCFAKFESGHVERMGCGSSVNSKDIQEWTAQKKLYRCNGKDCNELTKLPGSGSCVSCNSSNAAACAQNPTTIAAYEVCDAPNNECFTKVDSDGHTIRGCLNKLDLPEQTNCVATGTCAVCTGDRCNTETFPSDRRKCHICSSSSDQSCYKSPNALQFCPKYVKNDRCVSKHESGVTQRGCASDFVCETHDENNCHFCNTDGCNTADLGSGALVQTGSLLLTTLLAYISMRLLSGH